MAVRLNAALHQSVGRGLPLVTAMPLAVAVTFVIGIADVCPELDIRSGVHLMDSFARWILCESPGR